MRSDWDGDALSPEALAETDLGRLDAAGLQDLLRRAEAAYAALEAAEPADEESDEYEDWMWRLEGLDDLMDEIHERLESGEG